MIRINLIPPEITEKRKDEQRWKWVIVGAVAAAVVLLVFWAAMLLAVQAKQSDVAAVKQEAEQLQGQTARFQIFQQKESDLKLREGIYESAKAGRVDWTRILNEVALVLPSDVFLDSLAGSSPTEKQASLNLVGQAVHMTSEDSEQGNGFKAVAKMLVRLTELPEIEQVWLSTVTHGSGAHSKDPWTVETQITGESTPTAGTAAAPPPVAQ